jgi:hypothetical protein
VEPAGRTLSGFPHAARLLALHACFDLQIFLARKGAIEGGQPGTGWPPSSWN